MEKKITILLEKGVQIPNPESVYIADDVNPDRISGTNVAIYGGSKIMGPDSLIMENSTIGLEAPATLDNTLVGKNCRLAGGFFQGAVFAGDNAYGSGAHVRSGTILEEQANAAHTVGLKQTLLFPFVTLGSLINFCDCFMAGGTSRKDHSEVGSSFIHFNYTPNQDKATASMMGNVHQGVMLDQPPIFLGGQGGLVGPLRIGFGCITAAGSVVRKDEEKNSMLILGGGMKSISVPRSPMVYTQISRIYNRNIQYIAGLISLKAWYAHVRPLFIKDPLYGELVRGMQHNLADLIKERISRLGKFCQNLAGSKEILTSGKRNSNQADPRIADHDKAIEAFKKAEPAFAAALAADPVNKDGKALICAVESGIHQTGNDYIQVIQDLGPRAKQAGTRWLYEIETGITAQLMI